MQRSSITQPPSLQQTMDEESRSQAPEATNKKVKQLLLILNCLLLTLGSTGGPLISRLYFLHGGHRRWLSSFLETAGFPIILVPLSLSYFSRLRRNSTTTKPLLTTLPIFCACAILGLMTGADDFLYAYGLSLVPVSTSAILISTQLAFTAFFAFLLVKQKFTPFSLNSVALLTVGALVLGIHASSDRPKGVSKKQYFAGFVLSLGAAALYGLVLPLIELTYRKAKQEITYTLVMEMQFVMGAFATGFCVVGMLVNKDFEVIPGEGRRFGLGETMYYFILVVSAVLWQFFFLGAVGVIFCANTLLAGVIIALSIPVTEALAVLFYHEKFGSEKGVALALSLWGLASYSYGEYLQVKSKKEDDLIVDQAT